MLGATEDENRMIERCIAGQLAKLRTGDPRAFNAKPIAREWDEQERIFKLVPEIAEEWRYVVRRYLDGIGTRTIGREIIKRGGKIPYGATRLLVQMKKGLGEKWSVTFKENGETFTFPCERIVDQETERRVQKKMKERKLGPRRKPYKYLLSGKIRCAGCEKELKAKPSQRAGSKSRRYYYFHPPEERTCAGCVKNVRVEYIDHAVLKECFVLFGDKYGFEDALKNHLPNDRARLELEARQSTIRKELSSIQREREKMIDRFLAENLAQSLE